MLKVCAKKCEQCLFTKGRVVTTQRMVQILRKCSVHDTHFMCHKADDVVCRGFYDTQTSQAIRIAQRLGAIEFIDS